MHIQVRARLIVLAMTVIAVCAALLAPLTAMQSASAATFTPNCVPQYPAAPAHQPSATSAAGLASTASTKMPKIVKRAPLPGHPKWDGDDRGNGFMQVGNIAVGGGDFAAVTWNGKTYKRHNVFAFNVKTGEPTSFAPDVDGEVLTVTPSCTGSAVYLGGNFHHVNGVTRNYLAKVNLTTGKLAAWAPKVDAPVSWLSIMHDHLVMSGLFTEVNGVRRDGIASVNQTRGGALQSWLHLSVTGHDPKGPRRVYRVVANHAGTYAVMIGNFNKVSGNAHRRIAVLRLGDSKAAVTTWNTSKTASHNNANHGTDCSESYPYPERDVAWSPDDRWFVTVATGGAHAGSLCDAAAKWDASSSKALANPQALPLHIQYTGGDTMSGAAATIYALIFTGHFRWGGNPPIMPALEVSPCNAKRETGHAGYGCQNPGHSVDRPGVMEVHANTMHTSSWNPGRSRQRAMHNYMAFTPEGLWILSDGDHFGTGTRRVDCNDMCLVPYSTPLR